MAKPDKVAAVAELREKFTNSSGAVLTDYRGLSVKALKQLRVSLGSEASYAVSKNTLTTIAAREAGLDELTPHLVGPTAIAFIAGDPVLVAKGLRDFARANPQLVIKGGVLDGAFLSSDEVKKLADLESREVLLAKVAGAMQGILQQAISLISAPLSQAARLFAALEAEAEKNPSLLAAAPQATAEEVREPTNAELAAEGVQEPTNEQLAAEEVQEPTNEELTAQAQHPASEETEAGLAGPEVAEDTSGPTNEELAAEATASEPGNAEPAAAAATEAPVAAAADEETGAEQAPAEPAPEAASAADTTAAADAADDK
jgi:large subunit ribosomal protein L10